MPETLSSSPSLRIEIPRLWPGSTIVCLGAGPSVTQADLDRIDRSLAHVIAINTMYTRAPFAEVLYAGDLKWWEWQHWATDFKGMRVTCDFRVKPHKGVVTLAATGHIGIETRPWGLRTGGAVGNSGYQAINLAVHFGASRIVLVGYDMQPGPNGEHHCHPDHPDQRHVAYQAVLPAFQRLQEPLDALGVDIVNCTRRTALHAFPEASLEAVLG